MLAATTSLSSQLLTYLAESDWWTANKAKPINKSLPNDSKLPDAILEASQDRPALEYHVHNTLSSLARLIATLAIDTFIAPCGLIYHTSQALSNYQLAPISKRHWICAKSELIRVICVVNFLARLTLPSIGILSSLLSSPLLVASCAEIIFTLINPLRNSRALDTEDDILDSIASNHLKWSVGYVNDQTKKGDDPLKMICNLMRAIKESILVDIGKLQQILPEEHRLPFEPELNIWKIIEDLEESRKQLSAEQWTDIFPLCEHLLKYDTLYQRLKKASLGFDYIIEPGRLQSAYTDNHRILIPERTLPNHKIRGLTQTIYTKMLSSSLFSSLNSTFQESYKAKNSLRWIATFLTSAAILSVAAPIGTLLHTSKMLYYMAQTILLKDKRHFKYALQARAHSSAAWDDFISPFTALRHFSSPLYDWAYTMIDKRISYIMWNFKLTDVQEKLTFIHTPTTLFEKLINRIVNKNSTPESIFNIEIDPEAHYETTQKAIDHQYRVILSQCHPDKNKGNGGEKYNIVFDFLKETKEYLIKKYRKTNSDSASKTTFNNNTYGQFLTL